MEDLNNFLKDILSGFVIFTSNENILNVVRNTININKNNLYNWYNYPKRAAFCRCTFHGYFPTVGIGNVFYIT